MAASSIEWYEKVVNLCKQTQKQWCKQAWWGWNTFVLITGIYCSKNHLLYIIIKVNVIKIVEQHFGVVHFIMSRLNNDGLMSYCEQRLTLEQRSSLSPHKMRGKKDLCKQQLKFLSFQWCHYNIPRCCTRFVSNVLQLCFFFLF